MQLFFVKICLKIVKFNFLIYTVIVEFVVLYMCVRTICCHTYLHFYFCVIECYKFDQFLNNKKKILLKKKKLKF